MRKTILILLLSVLMTQSFANTCQQQAGGGEFQVVSSTPSGILCFYKNGYSYKAKETPGRLEGPWHSSGWSAWCGGSDHSNASLCQFF